MLSPESRLLEQIEDLKEQVRYWRGMVIDQESDVVRAVVALNFNGLTPSEVKLLLKLWNGRGNMVSNLILLSNHEGGDGVEVTQQLMKVFICKLRRKIGKDKVITHWGVGYSLCAELVEEIDSIVGGLQCVSSSQGAATPIAKAA